jgi:16S rRNA pseudouridine516 synthase
MRLDKFVAHTTAYSRNEVRQLARQDRLCVNGEAARDPSLAVSATDVVTLDGQALRLQGPRYFMLHKPEGVVCATEDGDHRTVLDLLPPAERAGLHVAGRLDIDSTGLVLLTDDGQWSHRIKAPNSHKAPGRYDERRHEKRYRVQTARPIPVSAVAAFAQGLHLRGEEDHPTRPARLQILSPCTALVWLQEGRYHQIKRMFAAIGNHVEALHREAIASIELDPALAPGQWRPLRGDEIAAGQVTKIPIPMSG